MYKKNVFMGVYYVKKFQGLYIIYLVVYQVLGETATGSRAMSPSVRIALKFKTANPP